MFGLKKYIDSEIKNLKDWDIGYTKKAVQALNSRINCLEGKHDAEISRHDSEPRCKNCYKQLGKIVPIDSVCKAPKN